MNTIFLLILIAVVTARVGYLYHVGKVSEEGLAICALTMFMGGVIIHYISSIGCGV